MIAFARKLLCTRSCAAARCLGPLPSFPFPILFSSSSTEDGTSVETPFITDYLISTMGLLPEKAIQLSKSILHIKSPSQPDAVLQLLKESGLSDAGIRSVVSSNVRVLAADVVSTLKPNMKALNEFGVSETELLQLIAKNPPFLLHRAMKAKMMFWMSILGSKSNVLAAFLKGRDIISADVDKNVKPKVLFLRDCGISDDLIPYIMNSNPNIISLSLDSIKNAVKRAEELGFSYGSVAFCSAFICLCQISKSKLESKLGLMTSFGWSDAEITSIIRKTPYLLKASENRIKERMEFFLKGVGCEPSYVMLHPRLLLFSVERRLTPRYHVLQILKSKGLVKPKFSLNSFMAISKKLFVEKYVTPYLEVKPLNSKCVPSSFF